MVIVISIIIIVHHACVASSMIKRTILYYENTPIGETLICYFIEIFILMMSALYTFTKRLHLLKELPSIK